MIAARDYPVSSHYVHDSQDNIISTVQTREPHNSGGRARPSTSDARGLTNEHSFRRNDSLHASVVQGGLFRIKSR